MQEIETKEEKIGSDIRLTSPTNSDKTIICDTISPKTSTIKREQKELNRVGKYLTEINQRIRKNCSAHITPDGRIFYQNHETKTSSWLPPIESWNSDDHCLPYGWETAIDKDGKLYFINHVNKTTTYEDPRKDSDEEPPPMPREVELIRDSQLGFGFVAGSEKPVIVRFVKEGGPSEHHLQAGDQILKINGEDVMKAPREHVIELVKSCKHSVTLTICQPHSNNSTRKSALLTAAKKAKLKSNPSRVRFAEGVVINGSPLFCPMSTFESCVPFLPNVLKVFLENGQTKTFKYDSSTTIQDVLNSLLEKLSIKCSEHFSLVCEHIKAMRRNRLTLLDPKDTLAKIAARPGAHNLRCLFRVMFVPRDAFELLQRDPISFEYLYNQCCNDVVQERFSPELKHEIALRLSALQLYEHSINSNGMQTSNGKVNLKIIERECGLESFVPFSLLESMKRKDLHKMLNHFLKLNQQLCPTGQKALTAIQAKLHYLKIVSELPSYGAKMFSTNIKDSTIESGLLVSPKFGISHVNSMRNSLPITLTKIEDISYIRITKDDELYYCLEVQIKNSTEKLSPSIDSPLHFTLEDREAEEFVLILKGYHRLFNKYEINSNDKELPVFWDISEEWWDDSAPSYCGLHTVQEDQWSYVQNNSEGLRRIDLAIPPPRYMPCDISRSDNTRDQQLYTIVDSNFANVDHNMNEKINCDGIDLPSLVSMEILESQVCETNVKSEDIIKRVSEMNKIISDAEHYLAEEDNTEVKQVDYKEENTWDETEKLKATDSLLLLTKINGNIDNSLNDKQNVHDVINGELSANESDTDSLMSPNESPLRRINGPNSILLSNGCNVNPSRTTKSGSSFGLHSPDVYPNLLQAEQDLIESLKQLRSEGEFKLNFSDDICLDSDLIDLTVIPPPDTPEGDLIGSVIVMSNTDDPPTPYREDIDFSCFSNDDSARVVAELDNLCDTLSEMRSSASDRNQNQQYLPEDIDDFIAFMTMPPPPVHDQNDITIANNEEYLSSFIIPPPPSPSPALTKAQDDVIARFWKVTDDIKKMCNNDDISPRLFKREVHSSSSGESGYDSAFNSSSFSSSNSDCPVFPDGGSPKLSLPTVIEVVSSENEHNLIHKQFRSYRKSDKINSNESNSCEDLYIMKDISNHQINDSNTATVRRSPNLSRSHSWNNLPTNSTATPPSPSKFPKPPIPPCSPSIQERRRQLAMRSNGTHSMNGSGSQKQQSIRNGNAMNVHELQNTNGYHPIVQNIMTDQIINGCLPSDLARNETEEIFIQSQRDIDILLARLEEVHENRLSSSHTQYKCKDRHNDCENFMAAKEALVTESRQFVTASKLFVKCATEASPQLLEYLIECVTLLERMYSVGEIVLIQMESQAQITRLVDRLKEVAATYAYTVDTVHKLSDTVCSPSSSPYMGLLMSHATSLATSLSALMKTLRTMNM